ncbi:MAG: hypothetical protein JSS89_06050 [Bacteroidetes bacterium]|nr:hypothetical protein [Bacteroidota bacterium]
MLFPYTYVDHPLAKLHGWIEHLLTNVWCRAEGAYSVTLLCQELQDIADTIHHIDTTKRSIFDDIRDIDALIQALDTTKRSELVTMFTDSTAVDDLCQDVGDRNPYSYDDLVVWNEGVAAKLKDFFYALFDKHIKNGPIKRQLGDLKSHVDVFCKTNNEGICPFCGLEETRDEYYTTRDPYDHYLPRHKYPFNSVNFRNLAPMCHTCNSSYKTTKDPISRNPGTRQKTFAPLDAPASLPAMRVEFDISNIQHLSPNDITLLIESATHPDECETWQWLFGIQERYKGKLCKRRGAYMWLNTVLKDSANYNKTPQELLSDIRANTSIDPFVDDGFLKLAALAAFHDVGLL